MNYTVGFGCKKKENTDELRNTKSSTENKGPGENLTSWWEQNPFCNSWPEVGVCICIYICVKVNNQEMTSTK